MKKIPEIGETFYAVREYQNDFSNVNSIRKSKPVIMTFIFIGQDSQGLYYFQDAISFFSVGNFLSITNKEECRNVIIECCDKNNMSYLSTVQEVFDDIVF